MNILICEDSALIALTHEAIVEDLGHRCCGVAATYRDAIALAASERPDLALVDIDLADGRTGEAIVAALAERGVASVVVSGKADNACCDAALAALLKPLDPRRLKPVLDRACAG